MKTRLFIGFITFVSLDVGISFSFWNHGTDVRDVLREVSDLDVFTGLADLFLMSLVRGSVLIGAICGYLCNPALAPRRLRNGKLFANVVCMLMTLYAVAKLLMYWERERDVRSPWVWLLLVWTVLASVSMALLWRWLGSVKELPAAGRRGGSSVNRHSGENGEVAPLLTGSCGGGRPEEKDGGGGDGKEGPSRGAAAVWQLIAYSKPDIPYLLLAFVALLIAASSDIFVPLLTGQVIDGIVLEHDFDKYARPIVILAIISAVSSVATGVRGGTFTLTMARLNIRIRNKLFVSLLSQEMGFFDTTRTGDITSRLTSDTTTMSDTLNLNINIFLRSTVKIIGFVVVMVKLSWQLTVITFVGIPLIIIVSEYYGEFYEKLSKRLQDSLAEANNVAEETISTIKTVRSFAGERQEAVQYAGKLKVSYKLWRLEALVFGCYAAGNALLETVMLILSLYYGGHLVVIKAMSSGQLISFLLYQMELGTALDDIATVYTGLMQAVGASAKVFELIARETKMKNDGRRAPGNFRGVVEFKDVSFAYPSRPDSSVLKNVSFTASPGEVVTLVGPSGGGKSTCVSLLEHFYDPSEGQVLVDGIPIQDYDHEFIHNKLALVGQEPVLYARSIQKNVAYGLPDCSFDDVRHACQLSNADTFVTELGNGYETQAGEKGTQLSGGQKQRIAIARALVRNPRVLILDEATSALDAESEHAVQEAIGKQSKERTVLIVAHRLSTIKKASKIVVIDRGRVVESGTHNELVAMGGMYANLVHRQLLDGDGECDGDGDGVFRRSRSPVRCPPRNRNRASYHSLITEGFFSVHSRSVSYGSINNGGTPSCSV